jgi:alcohol dehydrogenase class IV
MQRISIYPGSLIELKKILSEINPQKIFLVRGVESFSKSGAEKKLKWLNSEYNIIHYHNFKPNPSINDVIQGVNIFNSENCDLLLSIGGGSAIDIAKLINYYKSFPTNRINCNNINTDEISPVHHICIPLTAGSGSESTHFAVVYDGYEKFSVAHKNLIPNYVLIDPELHISQTAYQKAVSGTDALAQSIESFWSVNSTEESMIYSQNALKLIWENLDAAVNSNDLKAHFLISVGANLAGKAINIAKTTAPHALSYGFTKYVGLPHGHAVALSLSKIIDYNLNVNEYNCDDCRGVIHVKTVLKKIFDIIESTESLNLLFNKISIETDISKLNITNEVVQKVITNINKERLMNNPVIINNNDLKKIFAII